MQLMITKPRTAYPYTFHSMRASRARHTSPYPSPGTARRLLERIQVVLASGDEAFESATRDIPPIDHTIGLSRKLSEIDTSTIDPARAQWLSDVLDQIEDAAASGNDSQRRRLVEVARRHLNWSVLGFKFGESDKASDSDSQSSRNSASAGGSGDADGSNVETGSSGTDGNSDVDGGSRADSSDWVSSSGATGGSGGADGSRSAGSSDEATRSDASA